MKRRWKVLWIIALFLLLFFGLFWGYLTYGLRATANLILENIDCASIEDGTYQGEYHRGRFAYRVEVVVRDHAIEEVRFLSVPRISVPTIHQEIMERLKGARVLPVDTISGATASSKAILKAIENALKR